MSQQQQQSSTAPATTERKWYRQVPDPMVLIFLILVAAYLMTFIVPAGEFERETVDGQTTVIPGSFDYLADVANLHIFRIFVAIPEGLVNASQFLFIVFIAGGLFHILQRTGALENAIGVAVHKVGAEDSVKSRNLIIAAGTFIYGFFGVAVGFENNIALVPIGVLIATAIGCSRLVGVVMAVGGIGIGFALSPINPYTVGVAQGIGELPTFSGWWLRTLMVVACLATLTVFICRYVVNVEYHDNQAAELTKQLKDYRLTRTNIITLGIFVTGLLIMLVGVFTRRDLLRPTDTRLILVDHNELSQAVPGAEEAEIVEVVDHHRLGDLRTQEPILFLNRPVGSTCTIVADLFRVRSMDVSPSLAGVLMGGLVSDTLNLRSPTTTPVDAEILSWLEGIAGVTGSELAELIFSSGSVVKAEDPEDVVALDRKLYEEGRFRFAISQVEELGFGEFWKREAELSRALEESRVRDELDFAALLVTDVKSQDSLLLVQGSPEVIERIPYPEVEEGEVFRLDGIVSRKKQLLPFLTGMLRTPEE